jgi:predicted transcriptional regulator of viral defense system
VDPELQSMLRLFENAEMRRVIVEKGIIERDHKTGAERVDQKAIASLVKLLDMDHKISSRDPKKQLFFSDGARLAPTTMKKGIIGTTGKATSDFYKQVRREPGSSMGFM